MAALLTLSVPADAALEIFDRTGITPAVSQLTDSVPGVVARMLDAERREDQYHRLVQGTPAAAQHQPSPPGGAAAPAASANLQLPASEGWIARARSAYERVIVPALSEHSSTATAMETAQADKTPAAAPSTGTGGEAVVPPVKREKPVTPPAEPTEPAAQAKPGAQATPPPASAQSASKPAAKKDEPYSWPPLGVLDRVNDWLARANREYQGTIVKGLSSPSPAGPGEDAIAKKIEEDKAAEVKKAQEAAAQKVAADKAAEAAKKAEGERKAAEAKALEAKQLEADRKKAEETGKLADEASRKADEILKEAQKASPKGSEKPAEKTAEKAAEKKPEAQPKVATPASPPVAPPPAKPDDAERKAAEAKLRAEEARKHEEARQAEAAHRAEEEQKRAAAREAEARAAAERQVAEAEAAKHERRRIVLTPEPITRPQARATPERPERISGYRTTMVQETAVRATPVRQRLTIYQEGRDGRVRGTAVRRWIWRTHTWSGSSKCRYAGRRIAPPGRYTVARGDSLWRISEKYYASGAKYPRIYRANRGRIADPDLIYPCQRFRVPRR